MPRYTVIREFRDSTGKTYPVGVEFDADLRTGCEWIALGVAKPAASVDLNRRSRDWLNNRFKAGLPLPDPFKSVARAPALPPPPARRVRVIGAFCVGGEPVQIGDVLNVPADTAADLAARGKVEPA